MAVHLTNGQGRHVSARYTNDSRERMKVGGAGRGMRGSGSAVPEFVEREVDSLLCTRMGLSPDS